MLDEDSQEDRSEDKSFHFKGIFFLLLSCDIFSDDENVLEDKDENKGRRNILMFKGYDWTSTHTHSHANVMRENVKNLGSDFARVLYATRLEMPRGKTKLFY